MRERYFKFKQFGVYHQLSAMKVGADAVLLGAWTDVSNAQKILDVGCGCGVITLMLAQRADQSLIEGVDIDEASVEEAQRNVNDSPWRDRVIISNKDFMSMQGQWDLIVSNPPYFDDGVQVVDDSRMQARHAMEDGLSPSTLLYKASKMLSEHGKVSMICPPLWLERLRMIADRSGLSFQRLTRVKGNADAPIKRLLLEFGRDKFPLEESDLILEYQRGEATAQYRELTKDFYLKF